MAQASMEAESEQALIDAQVLMAKNQGAGLDSILEANKLITGKRDAGLDVLETMYLDQFYRMKNRGASQA